MVRRLLTILEGVPKASVVGMLNAIRAHTGTPQSPVEWSDPATWIGERLSGGEAALARRIWEESDRIVYPRHIYGAHLFINGHGLLVPDATGVYRLSDGGDAFWRGDTEVRRGKTSSAASGLTVSRLFGILVSLSFQSARCDVVGEELQWLH
jgi:hypothetical protein